MELDEYPLVGRGDKQQNAVEAAKQLAQRR
jgi:hypothetical protein